MHPLFEFLCSRLQQGFDLESGGSRLVYTLDWSWKKMGIDLEMMTMRVNTCSFFIDNGIREGKFTQKRQIFKFFNIKVERMRSFLVCTIEHTWDGHVRWTHDQTCKQKCKQTCEQKCVHTHSSAGGSIVLWIIYSFYCCNIIVLCMSLTRCRM